MIVPPVAAQVTPVAGCVPPLEVLAVNCWVLPAATITARDGTALLDLRSLEAGVYLLKVEGTGYATVRKLVVNR